MEIAVRWGGGGTETVCGRGSTLDYTAALRRRLGHLFADLPVQRLVDAGCGDFNWMGAMDLARIHYTGLDIQRFPTWRPRLWLEFRVADVTRDPLPCADAILCRDVLQHLPLAGVTAFLANAVRSGSTWLLATNHPGAKNDDMLDAGGFCRRDLTRVPFRLCEPVAALADADDKSKTLSVWRIDDNAAQMGAR